jgi:hypothetical protein
MRLYGKSDPPPAPDPRVVAEAQTKSNKETAIANAYLNRVDQTSPYGTSTYQVVGTNPDGTPKTHKSTGNFMKKIGVEGPPPAPAPVSNSQAFNLSRQPDKFDSQADMALQALYGVAAGFLSDEVRPDNKEEHESIRMPLAAVMREKQFDRITPTQLLIVSLLAYVGKKATKPTVKERFMIWVMRIRNLGKPKQVQPAPAENPYQPPRV